MQDLATRSLRPRLSPPREVLVLAPDIREHVGGGIAASGRVAMAALGAALPGGRVQLFAYAPGAVADASDTIVSGSKGAALRAAFAFSRRPDLIVVWHLHLLRLVPLFRPRKATVALMLLGTEAWRRHDPLTGLLLRRVDRFLSISAHTWQRFLEQHPAFATADHRTVHLGLGEPTANTPPPTLPPAALVIGRLARSEGYKGHAELIRAWPAILRQLPGAELWIAGDGDLRPELERLASESGAGHAIRFFGQVSEQHKQTLIGQCRCMAMPSRGEGFGLVYLEAMRLGRPCLVSTLDAGREVVNPPEAGLAADPRDEQALVQAICALLTPGPRWNQWSEQAHNRYNRLFTARHFQQRLLDALRIEAGP